MRGLKRLGLLAVTLLLAAGFAGTRAGAKRLSEQADPPGGRIHAGLGGRHHRARARQPHGPDSRAAGRGREQARRRLEPGRRIRRSRAEGRLHAVPAGVRQHRQRGDQPQPAVRHRQGLCADRAGQRGGGDPGGASVARRQQRAGIDRAREIQARRTELRVHRDRQRAAFLRRAVHAAHRDQACARALSGQPAGGDRSARRPRPGDVLARHGRDLAGPGRQAEGAGVGRQQARRHPARCADHDRIRHAGFRHRDLVRPDGAGGHAARGDRQAFARGARGGEVERGGGGVAPAGRRSARRRPRRARAPASGPNSSAGAMSRPRPG